MAAIRAVRFLVGVAMVASAAPVIASATRGVQVAPAPQPQTLLQTEAKPKVHRSPYSRLFAVPDLKGTMSQPPALESVRDLDKPTVVCGTKLVPIDPAIDPKIYLEPRRGDTRYSMRVVPSPVCR
jgi:hypothetical protein